MQTAECAQLTGASECHELVRDHMHCDVLCRLARGLRQLLGELGQEPVGIEAGGTLVFTTNISMLALALQGCNDELSLSELLYGICC